MKSFNRLTCILLCLCAVLTFVSCDSGNEGDPNESSTDPTVQTTVPDETSNNSENQTTPVSDETTAQISDTPLPFTAYYDDYLTHVSGVSASAESAAIKSGDALELIEVGGIKYFHAKQPGTAQITDGNTTVDVTVQKAKINIIVVMGQSNSGNHFDNATSDISCPLGTAYWWGNGKGLAATEPVDFTHATKGFHSPLLAELYAQSVKNGEPVKNVLVWHEGGNQSGNGTSKNGSSIYGWAANANNASGTEFTVKMVNKCLDYYKALSDRFEIISKGVYWLQGEGDGVRGIDPVEYTGCFMAMWNKLKAEAGLEYVAIMRVRQGGDNNTNNNDIHYSTTVAAQFALANNNPDIFMATTLTEKFTGSPTTKVSVNIQNYITLMDAYSAGASHSDKYKNTATYKDGVLTMPMSTLFGSNNKNHYGKFGYALIAADAAYNMYNALNKNSFTITQANSSGKPDKSNQTVSEAGAALTMDITDMYNDLSFRATPGSPAGTLAIKVTSAGKDVTQEVGVINASGANYGCVNIKMLKKYDDVKITATYTTKANSGTVTYNIIDNSIDLPENTPAEYTWDFNEDLFARDKEGNKVNAFNPNALQGSYSIENGVLKCTKAQLEILKAVEFKSNENWSIEIKFGDTAGSSGFIIATHKDNVKGNKALSNRGGRLNISDYDIKGYKTSAGYYNYYSSAGTITSGCVLKLVNTYNPTTGTSVMSLYKDGVLVSENMQLTTGDFNGGGSLDMSPYPVDADFAFAYLGCNNSSGSFLLTNQIDYIKINTGEK